MPTDGSDFSGCKFQKGDRVIPNDIDESVATVWGVQMVMKNHGGYGNYYGLSAPGYGSCMHYEDDLRKVDLPVSDFFGRRADVRDLNQAILILNVLAKLPLEDFNFTDEPDNRPITAWNSHHLLVGHVRRAREIVQKLQVTADQHHLGSPLRG